MLRHDERVPRVFYLSSSVEKLHTSPKHNTLEEIESATRWNTAWYESTLEKFGDTRLNVRRVWAEETDRSENVSSKKCYFYRSTRPGESSTRMY